MSGGAADFFSPRGPLAASWPGFEPRDGQREMALAVERVLDEGGSLVVEAGTGTGKTLAYLVPALLSGRKVVVSTGTKNLQDQIARKDVPAIERVLGRPVSLAVMKGRENYLCKTRWAEFDAAPLLEIRDEAVHLDAIREWAGRTETGDRAELDALPDRLRLWRDVNARADTCTGARCPEFETCHLTAMRRRADAAQLVLVNHHLFFADLAVRSAFGAVMPDYDRVIFDEAHLVEETATLYFGVRVGGGQYEELARRAERLAGGGKRAKGMGGAAPLRDAVREFARALTAGVPAGPGRRVLRPADDGGPDLDGEFAAVCARLDGLVREARRSKAKPEEIDALEEQIERVRESTDRALARDDPEFVYSVERFDAGGWVLAAAPIEVGSLLEQTLYPDLTSAIWTSATLAVRGSFDHVRRRLGLDADRTEALQVESPFVPEEQALLYLPPGMPEPRDPAFVERAVEEIEALLEISRGRAFLLFTSHAMLRRVHEALDRTGRWPLMVQGEGSRAGLLEAFASVRGAVLMGTASFWHGVDVKGPALSLVVVDKLPFAVPGDPLVSARIDRIRERGGNPFGEYQLPTAVLELKQGFGRLLRARDDRGALCILDPRIVDKRYGRTFLDSLPPYPRARRREDVAAWFARLSRERAAGSMPSRRGTT